MEERERNSEITIEEIVLLDRVYSIPCQYSFSTSYSLVCRNHTYLFTQTSTS